MRLTALLLLVTNLLMMSPLASAQTTCQPGSCGAPTTTIEANRWPNVRSLQIDDDVLFDRDYRQIEGPFTIHTAPDSAGTQVLGDGYTFVTVHEISGEWARIGDEQWVRAEILSETVAPSRFTGASVANAGRLALYGRLDADAPAWLADARWTGGGR